MPSPATTKKCLKGEIFVDFAVSFIAKSDNEGANQEGGFTRTWKHVFWQAQTSGCQ